MQPDLDGRVLFPEAGTNVVFALDLSGSMDQKDFELGNRRVDRLTATKAVASDFISRREGDRIGLILFGERAYLQVPLTLDRETVRILLLEAFIGLAGEKTAIGDAITLAVKRIHDQEADASEQVLILLTDGNDTGSKVPPIDAAKVAREYGITIYTIAIGDPATVGEEALDMETIGRVAEITGGQVFQALDQAITISLTDQGPVNAFGAPGIGFSGAKPPEFSDLHYDCWHAPCDSCVFNGRISPSLRRSVRPFVFPTWN